VDDIIIGIGFGFIGRSHRALGNNQKSQFLIHVF